MTAALIACEALFAWRLEGRRPALRLVAASAPAFGLLVLFSISYLRGAPYAPTTLAPLARHCSGGTPPRGPTSCERRPAEVDQRTCHGSSNMPQRSWVTAATGSSVTALVWHQYPLPYSSEPLPGGTVALHSLATFTPFAPGAAPAPVLEPLDAFYVPLGRFDGVERPGPRIEIFAIER